MLNSPALEVAIGLIFVFLIASLLATAVRELIEAALKTRAVQLERGIRQLLDDPDGTAATKDLFDHPQLFGLFDGVYDPAKLTRFWRFWKKTASERAGAASTAAARRLPLGSKFPSYIPSRNFAVALLDQLGAGAASAGSGANIMEVLRANAMTLQPGKVRDALLVALAESGDDFDRARTSLEAWFDSGMDRVSGWYKRESQVVLLAIGLMTAILFNIDAISITRQLADNNIVRQQLVVQAESARQTLASPQPAPGEAIGAAPARPRDEELEALKQSLGDLIGWPQQCSPILIGEGCPELALRTFFGWLVTALAISFGAPFWFDLLNKVMVIRATVKPFEKSPNEGSEDRRGGRPPAERLEPRHRQAVPAHGELAGAHPPPDAEGPIMGHVRLAVNMKGLDKLVVAVGDRQLELPADGMLEFALEMGILHQLVVTGVDARTRNPVRWADGVMLTTEDDLLPVEAQPV